MKAKGHNHFHVIPQNPPAWTDQGETTEQVNIETNCIFDNQWNTETDRVFDWYQYYEHDGAKVARGHWLEITPAMQEARDKTLKCGYCGKHYGIYHGKAPANGFCDACLDSEYLKESELKLLRLLPLSEERDYNKGLSAEERADLLPQYVERQTISTDSRAVKRRNKQRQDVIDKADKETSAAIMERDGMLWLWDQGLSLDNVIFYSHTETFSFGWRSPLSDSVVSKILDVISEFHFNYEIIREGKPTLSGNQE